MMQSATKLRNDDSILFKCPRKLVMMIDKECAAQMISRSAWLRTLVADRLREDKRRPVLSVVK